MRAKDNFSFRALQNSVWSSPAIFQPKWLFNYSGSGQVVINRGLDADHENSVGPFLEESRKDSPALYSLYLDELFSIDIIKKKKIEDGK